MQEQVEKFGQCLNEIQDDVIFKVYIGLKYIELFIEDVVVEMYKDGIIEVVSFVFVFYFLIFSVKFYNKCVKEEVDKFGGLIIKLVESWYDELKFVDYWVI